MGEKDGCCGGGCCDHENQKKDDGCCGGNCSTTTKDDQQHDDGCCGGGCACEGAGPELHLTAEQVARINTILGDVDEEDLATGNYDLTPEQIAELQKIFTPTQET